MSLTEILAEIPKLSFSERQELVRRATAPEDKEELTPEENAILKLGQPSDLQLHQKTFDRMK